MFDFLAKGIDLYGENEYFFRYGALVKTLFIFVIIFFYLKEVKTKINNVFIKWGFCLILLFIINQYTIEEKITSRDFNFNIHYFFRSLYPFAFLTFFFSYNDLEVIHKWIRVFKFFIILNSILIIIGFLIEIPVFKTYYHSSRFGYQGLLLYHSESGYIYFMSLALFYSLYKKCKSKINALLCILIMVCMLLIGTKKALFLFLLFLIYIIYDNRKSWNVKSIFFVFFATFFATFYIKDYLFNIIKITYSTLFNVYQKEGLLTTFFSYRNEAVSERIIPFFNEYWGKINYLIGGPAFRTFRVEMEVFDVFIFFGFSGLIIYFLFINKLIREFYSMEGVIMTIGILFAACFSGNFLASINVFLIYIFILKYYSFSKEP